MQWTEVKIRVTRAAAEAAADILTCAGAQGVAIEDPQAVNALRTALSPELCGIAEQQDDGMLTLTAYYAADAQLPQRLAEIKAGLALVEQRLGQACYGGIATASLCEQDWQNEWKRYYHVTHLGQTLVIKPRWEAYLPQPGEHVLELDPGMAFGTGAHHTTGMCMERLEAVIQPGATVFDIGSGSGILAITAALLGAGQVKAVDIDPVAVRVAAENIAANGLSDKIELRQGDLLHGTEGRADIIIANILAAVIIELLPGIPAKLTENGIFLASGIIAARRQEVAAAAAAAGMRIRQEFAKGGWLLLEMDRVK